MTFVEWYHQYMTLYKPDLAPKTLESYAQIFEAYIKPAFGDVALEALTPEHIQRAILAARGHRSAQLVFQLTHAVLRRAQRSRLISWSPADALDKPRYDAAAGKALTESDLAIAEPEIADDLSLALALYAGLRRGEIVGLQWGDVDLSREVLHIRRQRVRAGGDIHVLPPKSAAGVRDVPIAPQIVSALRRAFRLAPRDWLVDVAPETPCRRWQRLQRDLNLSQPYRLHDLRHPYVKSTTKINLRRQNLRQSYTGLPEISLAFLTENTFIQWFEAQSIQNPFPPSL